MFFKEKKNHDFLSIKIEKLIDWNEPNGEGTTQAIIMYFPSIQYVIMTEILFLIFMRK